MPVAQMFRGPLEHAVRFYSHEARLVELIRDYLLEGLDRRDAVLVISSEKHFRLIEAELARHGHDVPPLSRRGALRHLDAQTLLDRVLSGDRLDERRFHELLGAAMSEAAACGESGDVCVYSEIVDYLWRAGRTEAALQVEHLWDSLACAVRFRVLCAYRLDIFDAMLKDVPIDTVAKLHRGSLFDCDARSLKFCVLRAMREVLGADRAEAIRKLMASVEPPQGMARGPEFELLWLRDSLKNGGRAILERARQYFDASAGCGTMPASGPPSVVDVGPCTVLLVEDDPNDVFLVEYEVRRHASELSLQVARDGEAAWRYLKGLGPYADRRKFPMPFHVLIDLKLPKVSGFELLDRMQGDPDLKRLPVTVLTSSREPEDIARAYRSGAHAYVVKRADLADVLRGLASLCALAA